MTVIKLIEAPAWHHVDQGEGNEPLWEPEITDVDVVCALCGEGIGWVEYSVENEYGMETEGHRWREYYEIRAVYSGEPEKDPTLLCEDCTGWVAQVGPDIAAQEVRA